MFIVYGFVLALTVYFHSLFYINEMDKVELGR